jgi:hypothetical protein
MQVRSLNHTLMIEWINLVAIMSIMLYDLDSIVSPKIEFR